MEKIYYIYKITNNLNNKIYIGKHTFHKIENNYFGSGVAINNAIKKYGKENFSKEILFICDSEIQQNEMEILFISEFNSFKKGYNMTLGGDGMNGNIVSKKTRKKISESNKKFYLDNPLKRLEYSERAKLRKGELNPFFGKKLSKEHIEKMTLARVKAISGSNNPSAVIIKCIELDIIFTTAKEAAKFCGLSHSTTILKCAKGQRKKAGGYTWEIIPKL